ncbi:MAG: D-alanyl-D-alanine carboxypeptidase/D-alanyl-D-alanine-endopeptidase, partial [Deltaproteobacteria bacterium]|nr:D-alanyl-D-alanine carboxypeptidase/D-alanyl-D-alanine-endopeptidase [Deltaproteobacteria bacterium]
VLANSKIGVMVRDLSTDQVLYTRNHDQLFNVASNTKIPTAVAALSLLGPDFRFRTTLSAAKIDPDGTIPGDLFIRSHADPTLTTWDLRELAEELALTGTTEIKGALVVDGSYFDSEILPPHFDEQPKEQAGFRAPVAATSLNFNTVAIVVTPNPAGVGDAKVLIDPKNDYVRISGQISTVSSGRTRIRLDAKPKRGTLEVKVSGQIRREIRKKRYRLRVPDPVRYLGSAFRALLKSHGIKVRGRRIRVRKTPDRARVLATRESPALAEIIRALGKYSNNYVAEMLLKTIGAESLGSNRRPASWKDGLDAVRSFLEGIGVQGEFYYGNGSGLFESNKFSPEQLVTILSAAYRDFRIGPDFASSLSISGADGTIRRRMAGGAAERVVRAKTGTLDRVSALSGYVAIDGRTPVAFAVVVNDVPKWRTNDARSLQDAIATAIAQYLRRGQ